MVFMQMELHRAAGCVNFMMENVMSCGYDVNIACVLVEFQASMENNFFSN